MSPNGQQERRQDEAARAPQTPFRSCARLPWFACEDSWKIHEHCVHCRLLSPLLRRRCKLTPLLAIRNTAQKLRVFSIFRHISGFFFFYHLILAWRWWFAPLNQTHTWLNGCVCVLFSFHPSSLAASPQSKVKEGQHRKAPEVPHSNSNPKTT